MSITHLFLVFGGLGLFFLGMKLMGDGMKSVAGNKLELILYRLSNTTPKGVLLGTGVTTADSGVQKSGDQPYLCGHCGETTMTGVFAMRE